MTSEARVEVSVLLRPRRPQPEGAGRPPVSRTDFAETYGADPADVARLEAFARAHGLQVLERSTARRTVVLAGRLGDVAAAFGITLSRRQMADGTEYRAASAPTRLPEGVQAVFGLDSRPVVRPRE